MAKKPKAAEAEQDEALDAIMFEGDEDDVEGLVVDLSGVDENTGEYAPIPRGIYPVVLHDLTYDISQRSGNPMWTWVWEVEEGEYQGRRLWYHTTFTPEGIPRVKQALKCIGAAHLLQGQFKPADIAAEGELLGSRARVRVDVRTYEGQKRNNVRAIMPPEEEVGDI